MIIIMILILNCKYLISLSLLYIIEHISAFYLFILFFPVEYVFCLFISFHQQFLKVNRQGQVIYFSFSAILDLRNVDIHTTNNFASYLVI